MDQIERQLGAYRIHREIGRGGMSMIYYAIDERTGNEVALKVLLPQLAHDTVTLRRFRQEAENIQRMRHPNIIRVYEAGESAGQHYIAMEYASGGTLAQFLKQRGKPLGVEEALPILRKVAAALDYAHSRNILHRDVKPSNVLIGSTGQILLSDFGVARHLATDYTVVTMAGYSVGTPAYMSPEQARGDYDLDQRADIYSLGVVAYAMLTHALPFEADSQLVLLRKIIDDEPTPPDSVNRNLPAGVNFVLRRVLSKHPTKRYVTAGEFVDALEKGLTWQPNQGDWSQLVKTVTVSAPPPVSPFQQIESTAPRRNRAGAVAILLGMVAVILAMLALLRPDRQMLDQWGIGNWLPPVAEQSATVPDAVPAPLPTDTATLVPTASATATPEPSSTATPLPATDTPTPVVVSIILSPWSDDELGIRLHVPTGWKETRRPASIKFESPDRLAWFFVERLQLPIESDDAKELLNHYLQNSDTIGSAVLKREALHPLGAITGIEQTYDALLIGGARAQVRLVAVRDGERAWVIGSSVEPAQAGAFATLLDAVIDSVALLPAPTATATNSPTATETATHTATPAATATPIPTNTSLPTATATSKPTDTTQPAVTEPVATHTPNPTAPPQPTSTPVPTTTPTPTLSATVTPAPTETPVPTPTATQRLPTSTPVATFTALPALPPTPSSTDALTDTPMPTDTRLPTATATRRPATSTPLPTVTSAPTQTATPTVNAQATDDTQATAVAKAVEATLQARSQSATQTTEAQVATLTAEVTPTASPSRTATATRTPSLTRTPTRIPAPTSTPVATSTARPSPTATLASTPTATPTATATATPPPVTTPTPDLLVTLTAISIKLTSLAPFLTPALEAAATATPIATETPTPAPTPSTPLAATPANAPAPAPAGQITGFETFGTWRRGDEPYGNFTQSTSQVYEGNFAGQIAYNFPAEAGSRNYVVFLPQPAIRLTGNPTALQLQVYGDGSGHFLNIWVGDSANHTWQFSFGQIKHVGWAALGASLDLNQGWPNGSIDGAAISQLTPPLSLKAILLDGVPDGASSQGNIYLDALVPATAIVAPPTVAPQLQPTSAPQDAASTPVETSAPSDSHPVLTDTPAASAPIAISPSALPGRIAYSVFNGSSMDVIVYNLADGNRWPKYANSRQPDFSKGGTLLINGDGSGNNDIRRIFLNGGEASVTANPEDEHPQWSPSAQSLTYASTKQGDGRARIYWQSDVSDRFDVSALVHNSRELFGKYPIYLDNWRIAYQGCNYWDSGSNCGIYTTDTEGGRPNQATDQTSDIPSDSLGSRILFTANRNGNWDVYSVNWDGSGLQRLTDAPGRDGLATASPDYQHIAFVTDREGSWAVYVMNVDGTNQQKLFDLNGSYGGGSYEWNLERLSWGP